MTSGINVEEVIRGLRSTEDVAVSRLFDGLRIVPISRAEAEQAGQWRRSFAGRGVTLSQADCLIAAACQSASATLATANVRHFPMREVRVEDWPVGE